MEVAQPVVLKPTYKVRIERAVMIPMRDGKRLSADFIRPDAEGRFPAIVSTTPIARTMSVAAGLASITISPSAGLFPCGSTSAARAARKA